MTKLGRTVGGRYSSSSTIDGPGLPKPALLEIDPAVLSRLESSILGIALQWPMCPVLRILASVLGVIGWLARGDTVTIVPATAFGGGSGLLGLNSGWIRSCIGLSCRDADIGLFIWEDVGLEKFGGLEGGVDFCCVSGEEGYHPIASAVSEEVAWGEEYMVGDGGRNGPSKASAGDSGRLPGIGSSPDRMGGDEFIAATLSSRWTDEVSQSSKALSIDIASPAGKAGMSSDDLADPLTSFILDEPAPLRVDDDHLLLGGPLEVGVRGGE